MWIPLHRHLIRTYVWMCITTLTLGNKHRHQYVRSTGDETLDGRPASAEVRLIRDLLRRYEDMGTYAMPTFNANSTTNVWFGLRLIHLDIVEREQILKVSVWTRVMWMDEYLEWRPEDYGGIQSVVLPWHKVWVPDISLSSTADTEQEERHADLLVKKTGQVFWSPHRVYKSACLLDVTNFPYDEHTCHMWFQSMSRPSQQMDLHPYGANIHAAMDLSTYLESFEKSQNWEITGNYTEKFNGSKKAGVMLKFSERVSLRFTLSVRRRVGYLGHLLMLPCTFLGAMTIIVFILPPERPDRHSLAMSLFGSFMVLLLILVESAPPSASSIPVLAIYYACNMSLVMLSIFLSSIVIHISRRGDRRKPVPAWMEKVFVAVLSRMLLMHERISSVFMFPNNRLLNNKTPTAGKPYPLMDNNISENQMNQNLTQNHSEEMIQLRAKLSTLEEELKTCRKQAETEVEIGRYRAQWRNIGLVLDRLFVVIYFVIVVTTSVIFFPRPKFSN